MFPSLYTSMKNPRQYFRVLDWTFAIVIALYANHDRPGIPCIWRECQVSATLTHHFLICPF